jgi:hypothetical protein
LIGADQLADIFTRAAVRPPPAEPSGRQFQHPFFGGLRIAAWWASLGKPYSTNPPSPCVLYRFRGHLPGADLLGVWWRGGDFAAVSYANASFPRTPYLDNSHPSVRRPSISSWSFAARRHLRRNRDGGRLALSGRPQPA